MPSLKNLLLAASSALLLSNKVYAAGDCSILESAIIFLGDDFKNSYNAKNCCDFNGVTCDNEQHVTGIKFNNIKGSQSDVPKVFEMLSGLKYLTSLDLSNNGFTGKFPSSACTLKTLKSLDVSRNKFDGVVPYSCKDMENLEKFNLEGNTALHGYIPMRKITDCTYISTNLCNLKNASCKNGSRECTVDDINKTNMENGYPIETVSSNESTDRSVDGTKDRATNNYYYDDYVYNGYNYNGYTGYDYNNNGYGNTYGYDNTYGYTNDNSYDYTTNNYGYGNLYEDDYDSPFTALLRSFLVIGLICLLGFIFCLCCCCRSCCGSTTTTTSSSYKPTKPVKINLGGLNGYNTMQKPTSQKPTKINQSNPFVTTTTTTTTNNVNSSAAYPMPTPNATTTTTYQQQPYGQSIYQEQQTQGPYGYGNNRGVETVKEDVKIAIEEERK